VHILIGQLKLYANGIALIVPQWELDQSKLMGDWRGVLVTFRSYWREQQYDPSNKKANLSQLAFSSKLLQINYKTSHH
jgi:hypothetical protein